MAAYKTPKKYLIVDELPRNAMGKVVKNEVKQFFKPNQVL
jgi:malonyl-CoA/methylmalonyl-CoA synthetase